MERRISVRRIHNETRPPIQVHVMHADGSFLTIEPGETREGPWLVEYDPDEHPELDGVGESDWWFTDSPFEFRWGTVAFASEERTPVDFGRLYDQN